MNSLLASGRFWPNKRRGTRSIGTLIVRDPVLAAPTAFVFMRADPSLDANQNRKVVMSITARSIAVKDIGREATIFIRGDAMDRDEYLRRASALEKRAADCLSWPADRVTQHSGAISQSRQSNSGQQSGRQVPL